MASPTTSPNRFELSNSVHQLPHGAVAQRRTNPRQWIELTLGVRRLKDLPALAALDNVPPLNRRYMTHDELTRDHGSDPASVSRIEAFAEAHHLAVVRDDRASARITLGGTVADAEAAFGVRLFDYSLEGMGKFHARTGPVSVPAELKDDITGVFGFNNHRAIRRKPRVRTALTAAATAKTRKWFMPPELATVYNFPDANLQNQCIGLLEFGGGVELDNLPGYFRRSVNLCQTSRSLHWTESQPIPPPIRSQLGR